MAALMLVGALAVLPNALGQTSSVSGVVRDGRGTPQIGAMVELLRPDSSVVEQVFTDNQGKYLLNRVLPGIYGLKATGSLFLPTLREDLRILTGQKLVVDVKLNTLLEAFRWIPAQRRQADEPEDDWTWTLRTAANRPLLRVLEDGPLVVISNAEGGSTPTLKARVTVRGGASQFGDGGLHHNFEFARTKDGDRELILRADLSQSDSTGVNTVIGYEQDLAPNTTLRTVAAFEDRPGIAGARDQGMQSMLMRTAETMQLMDGVRAEIGSEIQAVRLGRTMVANHPFASVTVQEGDTSISYHVATSRGMQRAAALDRDGTLSPAITERNGVVAMEHGLHQELAAERKIGNTHVELAVYRDHLENPVVGGGGTISTVDWNGGDLLYDPSTELLTAAGQDYSTQGMLAEIKEKIGGDTWLSFSYAEGDALSMDTLPAQVTLHDGLMSLRPQHAQLYAVAMNGKVQSSGTSWRASYRSQTNRSVSPVDTFDTDLPDPFLSFYVRQPIHCRMVPAGMEALIDVRNLFAQGYRPFVTKDGSSLYFAQAERSLQGGLSFSF